MDPIARLEEDSVFVVVFRFVFRYTMTPETANGRGAVPLVGDTPFGEEPYGSSSRKTTPMQNFTFITSQNTRVLHNATLFFLASVFICNKILFLKSRVLCIET